MDATFHLTRPRPLREVRLDSSDETALLGGVGEAGSVPPVDASDWEQRLARAREEGRQEGFAAGRAEAEAEAAAQWTSRLGEVRGEALQEVRQVLESLVTGLEEVRRRQEEQLLELASAALEKLVGRLPAGEELALAVARDAVEQAGAARVTALLLHPEDHARLLAAAPEGSNHPLHRLGVPIRTNPLVGRGGCQVETDYGALDGSLQARLTVLREVLCA